MTKTYNIRISGDLVATITVTFTRGDGAELAVEEFLESHPELEAAFIRSGHVVEEVVS